MIRHLLLALTIMFMFSTLIVDTLNLRKNEGTSTTNNQKSFPDPLPPLNTHFNAERSLEIISAKDTKIIRKISFELSETEDEIAQGLMFRPSIPIDTGMLFIMEKSEEQFFYMKNTYVSLDIIFIDQNKRIINIEQQTTPLSETLLFSTQPAKYLLEVAAGYSNKYGIKTGDFISF